MTSLAVTGYASVDYAVALDGHIKGDRTTLIGHRDNAHWPRLGGCPAYAAIAAERSGAKAFPISWIGDDEHARLYVDGLAKAGVAHDGVANLLGTSPMSILAYQDDGSCVCLFDPAFAGEEELTEPQRDIIAAASHVCISVGPPHLMDAIPVARFAGARLYWICKNDHHCFTPQLRRLLSAEADVIFCSQSERGLVGEIGQGTIIVETRGTQGVRVSVDGEEATISVEAVSVKDTTGAGDTFAGAFIAAQMTGVNDPEEAAKKGIQSVHRMLKDRAVKEMT